MTRYDTDSFPIRIDNHSSYCVTNNKRDFVGPLKPLHANVKGIGGTVNVQYKGTVRWQWEDDFGRTTAHYIPDTIYMPSSPDRILSPQHWSQNKVQDRDDSAHVMTNHTSVILSWNQGKHVKTVPLNTFTNVAVMHSCPNFKTALRAYPSVVVSDDEDDEDNEGQMTSVFGIPRPHHDALITSKMIYQKTSRSLLAQSHSTHLPMQPGTSSHQMMKKKSNRTSHHDNCTKHGTID